MVARERAATAALADDRADAWIELGEDLLRRGKYAQASNEFSRSSDRYVRVFEAWKKTRRLDAYAACVEEFAEARAVRKQLGLAHIDLSEQAEQAETKQRPAFKRALDRCRAEVFESASLATVDAALKAANGHFAAKRFDQTDAALAGVRAKLDALTQRVASIQREELGRG